MSDETTALVRITVDEQGAAVPDGGEEIEVLLFPLRGLKARLLEEEARTGVHLDAKLWCFSLGLEVAGSPAR